MDVEKMVERANELMWNTNVLSREVTDDDGNIIRIARYYGFFGGPLASNKAKNYLRSLLRQHTGHPDAEAIRALFNRIRENDDRITSADVRAGIEVLKNL